jgi:hypothetical protein
MDQVAKEVSQSAETSDGEVVLAVPCEIRDLPTFRLHVDLSISGRQAQAARIAAAGLDRDRVTLENGRRCVGTNDLVRWFLERVADELEL